MRKVFGQAELSRSKSVYSAGGLGNQLFIWAFALWLKKNSTSNVILNTSLISQSSGNHGTCASYFPYVAKSLYHLHNKRPLLRHRAGLQSLRLQSSRDDRYSRSRLFQVTQFSEVGFTPNYDWASDSVGHGYFGLFQTVRYFDELAIDNEHFFAGSGARLKLTSDDAVAIHLRHGDYRDHGNLFGILPASYYIEALEIQRASGPFSTVRIFGNFDSQSKQTISSLQKAFRNVKFDFSNFNVVTNPYVDFQNLAIHSRQILSNSSFAWWAAALAQDGLKIAPSNWFRGLPQPNELLPTSWNSIEVLWK